jgi:hypothetical protein
MIDALFWYTGLSVWIWIVFICFLSLVVEANNRSEIKRGRGMQPD